jgi:hypothetical protein
MTKRILAAVAASTLLFAACGGGGDAQGEVADLYIEAMGELGDELGVDLDIDEGCVRDLADQLSDDDAQKLVDAGIDGAPEDLSAEADEIAEQLAECVSEG